MRPVKRPILYCAVLGTILASSSAQSMSRPENPRQTPGLEQVTGVFTGAGAECPQFRMTSGETVSLSGVRDDDLSVGTMVTLSGSWQMMSRCMQGRDFRVETIEETE